MIVCPLVLTSYLNVLVFLLPPGYSDKASYLIAVTISVSVFASFFNGDMPRGLDSMPRIFSLHIFVLAESFVTLLLSIVVLRRHRSEHPSAPPHTDQEIAVTKDQANSAVATDNSVNGTIANTAVAAPQGIPMPASVVNGDDSSRLVLDRKRQVKVAPAPPFKAPPSLHQRAGRTGPARHHRNGDTLTTDLEKLNRDWVKELDRDLEKFEAALTNDLGKPTADLGKPDLDSKATSKEKKMKKVKVIRPAARGQRSLCMSASRLDWIFFVIAFVTNTVGMAAILSSLLYFK
jgi:hypothetical protein